MNLMRIKRLLTQKRIMLGIIGIVAGALLLTSCGVSQETVDTKDREIASLRAQLASSQQDAKYWTQLSTIFMPVELRSMTDHKAFMTPGGLIVALHFDDMDLSKAQNLNWMAIGVPGKYSRQDQERIETLYGKGFTHFHDLMADTHGGKAGGDGVWFMHVAVRGFAAPWGSLKPGVDEKFMPTPAPDVP
ncbi:MAG: hypothetical protein HY325_04295 [Chloroflexi bacterium]|nr:hypothetical protein [Chloroflexota bacterium]